ncbi:MAG: hypothetical protein SFW67_12495 [Myxococcaceae bacterium]|nr:hypothetical protein [Myxococcaceae bacterium]
MIKKTAAALVAITLCASPARALEVGESPFSEQGRQKRLALTLVGVGGAVTMVGGVFFFVGRSGAGLHLNQDGTLQPRGDLEEARSALSLQRISIGIAAAGFATLAAGTVLLFFATRKHRLGLMPVFGPHGASVVLTAQLD